MAEGNAKHKELEAKMNRLQNSKNVRDQFIQFLRSSPSRPCNQEFVLFNLEFDPKPIEDWEVEEGLTSTRSIHLYSPADDSYIILNPGRPRIRIYNETYTSIVLAKSRNKCNITFSLPKE